MSDLQDRSAVKKFIKELNSGTVSLVLLAILDRSDKPLYGYEIAKRLEQNTQNALPMKRGTFYPVLRSMEEQGLLSSLVEPSISGPPRKYYSITEDGREVFGEWKRTWERTLDFVTATLKGAMGQDD